MRHWWRNLDPYKRGQLQGLYVGIMICLTILGFGLIGAIPFLLGYYGY